MASRPVARRAAATKVEVFMMNVESRRAFNLTTNRQRGMKRSAEPKRGGERGKGRKREDAPWY